MKKIKSIMIMMFTLCIFLFPLMNVQVHAAEYEVVFKAGSHGTVNGGKEVSYRLSNNDIFPNEPSIAVEDGYVFQGWSKELPEVGTNVTGKQVYVAKYGVVINGIIYTVRYVDENKVDIATATTMLGEKGTEYTVRAKTVPGYTFQETTKSFNLESNNQEIVFVYTLTNPDLVVRNETVYEYENVNQTVGGTTQGQGGNQANTNPETDAPENVTPAGGGENTPEEEETIEDEENPLANTDGVSKYTMLISVFAGVLLLAGVGAYLVLKKRKKVAAEQ